MASGERALDRGLTKAGGERSLPWYPIRRELIAPAMTVLLGFLSSWWLLAGPRNALYVLAGPWSAEWLHGRTPMPILAVALPGGALFWVVFVFRYLTRWEQQASFFRSAALVGLVTSWLFVGFVELALEPLL